MRTRHEQMDIHLQPGLYLQESPPEAVDSGKLHEMPLLTRDVISGASLKNLKLCCILRR